MNNKLLPIVGISVVSLFVILGVTVAIISNSNSISNSSGQEQIQDNNTKNINNTNERENISKTDKSTKVVDKACSVFSPQDIFQTFGITVEDGKELQTMKTEYGLPLASCEWLQSEEEESSLLKSYSINLTVHNHPDNEIAQQDFSKSRTAIGGLDYEDINGLADGAIFHRGIAAGPGKTQVMIEWIKDNVVYTLSAVRLDKVTQADEEKLKALVDLKF